MMNSNGNAQGNPMADNVETIAINDINKFHNAHNYQKNNSSLETFLNDAKANGLKCYKLKGYTTIGKIKQKKGVINRQNFLRKSLTIFIAVVLIFLIVTSFIENHSLMEWQRVIGKKSRYGSDHAFDDLSLPDLDKISIHTIPESENFD